MASTSGNVPVEGSTTTTAHAATPSKPVELNTLDTPATAGATSDGLPSDASIPSTSIPLPQETAHSADAPAAAVTTTSSTAAPASTQQTSQAPVSSTTTDVTAAPTGTLDAPISKAPELTRSETVAIGPETDIPLDATLTTPADTANPVCVITLLLTSGARHPYKLDEKYLTKRNVDVPGVTEAGKKDPFSISVYTLKELILREWRDEWDPQPSSPSSIRLIHFGRLLDDKIPLKECRFNPLTPNVVHMTVKPQDIVDDEEASKGKSGGRDRDGQESTPGCRCVIL